MEWLAQWLSVDVMAFYEHLEQFVGKDFCVWVWLASCSTATQVEEVIPVKDVNHGDRFLILSCSALFQFPAYMNKRFLFSYY